MACELIGYSSGGADCNNQGGGVVRTIAAPLNAITNVTVANGVITNFTMSATGKWKEYVPYKNNTSQYVAAGSRQGTVFNSTQTATLQFKGISADALKASNAALGCCGVVAVHFLSDGTALVQGLEYMETTGEPIGTLVSETLISPSLDTGTANSEAFTGFSIGGVARSVPQTTSLTRTALLAL